MELEQAASWSAYAAAVALVLSGVAFGLFLRQGVTSVWGPVNDVFTAITALLLVTPMLALLDLVVGDAIAWFTVVTWAAVAGAVLIAVGQLLLVARLLSLQGSFVTGGVGFTPVVAWIAAQGYLAITGGLVIDAIVGWLAIGLLALSAMLAAIARRGGPVVFGLGVGVCVVAVAWLAALGMALAG